MSSVISKYFKLNAEQGEKLNEYKNLLLEWNEKINLISRKDTEFIEEKHILHSLGIQLLNEIKPGFKILDVGTGGGLPGIPLAIMNPNSQFVLADSITKKITATADMAERLGLTNVRCENIRVEKLEDKFDIITGRAVTRLIDFYKLTHKLLLKDGKYILLKGGDLKAEINEFEKYSRLKVRQVSLQKSFEEEFYETKFVLKITKKK